MSYDLVIIYPCGLWCCSSRSCPSSNIPNWIQLFSCAKNSSK